LAPLKLNETLSQIAHAQANHIASLPAIPDGEALHFGPNGERTVQRATLAGWPHYATDVQTAVGEIACVNQSIDACMGWFQGSPPHYKIMSSPGFREVGAALIPLNYGL